MSVVQSRFPLENSVTTIASFPVVSKQYVALVGFPSEDVETAEVFGSDSQSSALEHN